MNINVITTPDTDPIREMMKKLRGELMEKIEEIVANDREESYIKDMLDQSYISDAFTDFILGALTLLKPYVLDPNNKTINKVEYIFQVLQADIGVALNNAKHATDLTGRLTLAAWDNSSDGVRNMITDNLYYLK